MSMLSVFIDNQFGTFVFYELDFFILKPFSRDQVLNQKKFLIGQKHIFCGLIHRLIKIQISTSNQSWEIEKFDL